MLLCNALPAATRSRAKGPSGSHDNIEIGGTGGIRAHCQKQSEHGNAMDRFLVDGRFLELVIKNSPTLRVGAFLDMR